MIYYQTLEMMTMSMKIGRGPFKYYVIKRMGGWGRLNDYVIT